MPTKKILFICSNSPYGSLKPQESLDILLMASTFDQKISLLFQNEGVLQLKKNQQSENILQKRFTAAYPALDLYEIKSVYADAQALELFDLKITDLITDVKSITAKEIKQLIAQQDVILNA